MKDTPISLLVDSCKLNQIVKRVLLSHA